MKLNRLLVIVVVVGLLLVLDFYYYSSWWAGHLRINAPSPQQLSNQKFQSQIDDLKLHGTALPACPLVFPLLDSKGHVTPLGSYLSYFGMKQAAYLPQAVLSLPDLDQAFGDFDLFNPNRAASDAYKTQLPFRFTAKDFAEGTWKKTYQGWKIHLHLWGTHPEKAYDQSFGVGNLHTAPNWIAGRLQDYEGFKPTSDGTAFLAQPVFMNDADLIRAANLESFFNHAGAALITHWQEILSNNPGRFEIVNRWMKILDSRENQFHPELMEALLNKQPASGLATQTLAAEYLKAGRFSDALPLFFSLLKNDDDNSALYSGAGACLQGLGDAQGGFQLMKNRTQKYPDNPEAWMALAFCVLDQNDFAQPTGNPGMDSSGSAPAPVLSEGTAAAQKASQLSPGDVRVWTLLIDYGTDAKFPRADLDSYLQKAVQLDPTDDKPFAAALSFLNDQGPVGAQDAWDFARKYGSQHPFLFYGQASKELTAQDQVQTLANLKNFKQEPALEQAYRADLKKNPANLDLWRDYLKWTDLAGTTPKSLAFAQTLVAGRLELKTLPPTLVLLSWETDSQDQTTEAQKQAVLTSPKAVSQMLAAYQILLALDDTNWNLWNQTAKCCVENHLDAEAKKAMDTIGDNFDESVWPRQDFDKARVALGLDPIPPQPISTTLSPQTTSAVTDTNVPIPPTASRTIAAEVPVPLTPTPAEKPSPEPASVPATQERILTQAPTEVPATLLKIQTPSTTADLAQVAKVSPQPTPQAALSPSPSASATTTALTPSATEGSLDAPVTAAP